MSSCSTAYEDYVHITFFPSEGGSRRSRSSLYVPINQIDTYSTPDNRGYVIQGVVTFDSKYRSQLGSVDTVIDLPLGHTPEFSLKSAPPFMILSSVEENDAITRYDRRSRLRWSRVISNSNYNLALARYQIPSDYRFSPYSDTLGPGQIVLHYDNFEAGFRLPFDVFFIDCMWYKHALPKDFTPGAVRVMSAFIVLCRLMGFEPSLAVFLHFYIFRIHNGIQVVSRPGNLRLFSHNGNNLRIWEDRKMLVESAAGWPFDKFDLENSNILEKDPSRVLMLSVLDNKFIGMIERLLEWNGTDQKYSFSWRNLIDTSNIYSSMVGLPGPSFRGIPPFRKLTPIFSHEAWFASCPHPKSFPSDCDICNGSDVPDSCSEMSFHPGRNDLLAQLDLEQLNSQKVLAEKTMTSMPTLVKESRGPSRGKDKSGSRIRCRESCTISESKFSKKGRSTSLQEISSSDGDVYVPSPNRSALILASCSELPDLEDSLDPHDLSESLSNFGFTGPRPSENFPRKDLYHALYNIPNLQDLNLSKIPDSELQIGLGLANRITQADVATVSLLEGEIPEARVSDAISIIALAASQACSILTRESSIFTLRENELVARQTRSENGRLEALQKLSASEKNLCDVEKSLSQLRLDLDKKNEELVQLREFHKEELRSHGAFASDESAYHVLRCLLSAPNYQSSMPILQKLYLFRRWLMMNSDDVSLRPIHSDIPFNKRAVAAMCEKTWVPPHVNQVNLRDLMVQCDAKIRERSKGAASAVCEQRIGDTSSNFCFSKTPINPFKISTDVPKVVTSVRYPCYPPNIAWKPVQEDNASSLK